MKVERLLFIGIIIIIIIGNITIFFPHFRIKDYKKTIELSYQDEYVRNIGIICYGNMLECKDVEVIEEGFIDTSKVGTYHMTYTLKHDSSSKVLEQDLIVKDKIKPTVTIDDEVINVCPNGKIESKIKAFDEYDGDLTNSLKTNIKDDLITIEVEDSSKNKTIIEKKVTTKDEIAPIIKLNKEQELSIEVGSKYEEPGATAEDNCDGDLTEHIEVIGSVNPSKSGNYTITYKVSDKAGNEATISRIIHVYEKYKQVYGHGTIYLTFDDGPGPYTEELLNILKKYNIKATFFVTDQALTRGYDHLIKRASDEGHTIGLHSKTHDYSYIYSSTKNYFDDLNAIEYKVERITGKKTKFIRFPGGSSNTISKNYDNGSHIMSSLGKMVTEKGYKYYDWNIVSGDAGETTNTDTVAKNVINSLGEKSTYVVLQHDIKKYSVDAVETIIKYGLSHGFTFKNITDSTPLVQHHINN